MAPGGLSARVLTGYPGRSRGAPRSGRWQYGAGLEETLAKLDTAGTSGQPGRIRKNRDSEKIQVASRRIETDQEVNEPMERS